MGLVTYRVDLVIFYTYNCMHMVTVFVPFYVDWVTSSGELVTVYVDLVIFYEGLATAYVEELEVIYKNKGLVEKVMDMCTSHTYKDKYS